MKQPIQEILKNKKIQAILVTKPENVRYLTGFIGTFGEVILTKTKKILITDARYTFEAKKICFNDVEIVEIKSYQEDVGKLFKKLKIENLGFESRHFSYGKFLAFKKMFRGTGLKLKPLMHEIDQLRIIKTETEIKLIEKSLRISEKILEQAAKLLKVGVTEQEIARKILLMALDLGAERLSFEPIVGFGKNSGSPHSTPSNTKYKASDVALIDMGVVYHGYCSDITRTFLPKKPTTEMTKVYQTVLEAQNNCINQIRSGLTGTQADKLCREVIKKAGYGENFTHASGHGVGLEIHESPSLSHKLKHKDRKITLEKSMVVTVEPGIYLSGKFGVRIEDMVVIDGKNLTRYKK